MSSVMDIQDLLPKICATYNLVPIIHRALARALFFSISSEKISFEIRKFMIEKFGPFTAMTFPWYIWVKNGHRFVFMTEYTSLTFIHEILGPHAYVARRIDRILNYFHLLQIQEYVNQVNVELSPTISEQIPNLFENLTKYICSKGWTPYDYDNDYFSSDNGNTELTVYLCESMRVRIHIHSRDFLNSNQTIRSVEHFEEIKALIARLPK